VESIHGPVTIGLVSQNKVAELKVGTRKDSSGGLSPPLTVKIL